jgi:tetratricopeptide (TPR) repeat protein
LTKLSVHQRKARDFIQREDWGNALSELQRMLAADGENPTLHNQIGDVYLRKEDVGSACQHFERAIDLYAEVGLHNNAVALCKKIMRLRPGRFEIRYRLARLRLEQGFRTEAAVFFAEYLEHAPTDGDAVDTLEKDCREIIELLPDDAPVGKMLEKLENASRFTAAFDLVRKLAQRAADAGDDAAAARYAEKMRSLRILVERSGGRDLLAEIAAVTPTARPAPPATSVAPVDVPAAPAVTAAAIDDVLRLDDASAALFADESAGTDETPPVPAEAITTAEETRSFIEPNVLPADFLTATLEPSSAAAAVEEPLAAATATPLSAESVLDFGMVDLPPLDLEPAPDAVEPAVEPAESAEPAPAPAPPAGMVALPDLQPELAEAESEIVPAPEYELPETSFADLVRDLGETILAPEFIPPLQSASADDAADADALAAACSDAFPLPPSAAAAVPLPAAPPAAPAPPLGALRDIPVWIPEGEATMPPAGPPPDAVASLDLESVIDSFREQMARALDGDGAARYDLGVAYFEMGLYNEALAEFEAAARCPGLEVQSYEMLAACLLATGRHAEVVELLVPVLAADGHAPRGRLGLQYSLGLAYDTLGDAEQARRCFEEVALIDIEFKDVQVRLQRL